MTQEIVIRKSLKSGGTKTITIIAQKVETSINKILIGLVFPNAKDNQGSGPKENKFVDLQRIERRYNVDGIISSDAGNSVVSGAVFGIDSSSTAQGKKNDLISIFTDWGVFDLFYESVTTPISVNSEKIMITENANDSNANPGDPPSNYDVKLTFWRGEDI